MKYKKDRSSSSDLVIKGNEYRILMQFFIQRFDLRFR